MSVAEDIVKMPCEKEKWRFCGRPNKIWLVRNSLCLDVSRCNFFEIIQMSVPFVWSTQNAIHLNGYRHARRYILNASLRDVRQWTRRSEIGERWIASQKSVPSFRRCFPLGDKDRSYPWNFRRKIARRAIHAISILLLEGDDPPPPRRRNSCDRLTRNYSSIFLSISSID